MRYRRTAVIGLCVGFGMLCASELPTFISAAVAQDADPFGGSPESQPSVQQKATRPEASDKQSAKNAGNSSQSSPTRLSDATRQLLREPVTIDYEEVPWSDVERDLESRLRINILLDQSAKDDSLVVDEPMSMKLRDVPGNYALRFLLREKNATYFVQAGVVRIISIDDAESDPDYFVRRVFQVDDLLGAIKDWNHLHRNEFKKPKHDAVPASPAPATPNASQSSSTNARVIFRTAASAGQFGGGGGGGGGGGFGYSKGHSGRGTEASGMTPAGEQLTKLIRHSVNEEQWLETGSGLATMSLVCGKLVVFGTETLVSDIDELLADLRGKLATD